MRDYLQGSLLRRGEVFEVLHQLLHVLQRNCIVVAGTHAANAAVALETLEQQLLGTGQKCLLLGVISAANAEANVHSAADTLVGHHSVHLGVLVQGTIDELRLFVGDLFLSTDLLHTECAHKVSHDLASNPKVEDGKSVVKGVVLGDGGIVEHDGTGEATNVQPVQKRRGRSGSLRREKVLANNCNGDTGDTDVLLCAALLMFLLVDL